MNPKLPVLDLAQIRLDRRRFFRQAGLASLGAAATVSFSAPPAFAESETRAEVQQELEQSKDTVTQIFTAALIAEDLATTFYYNALIGPVIMDPNLAGPGGSATNVTSAGNFGNVDYVRAALTEEIAHANLFRSLLGIPSPAKDPAQIFYFPAGSFDTLAAFTGLLDALENAFIGAYLNAIQEFATKSRLMRSDDFFRNRDDDSDSKYTPEQLDYFAKVAASIMGIECEHRVLGRVISNSNPANNLNYEQTDKLNAVYNGPASAVAALTPFLTQSTGPAYSLSTALTGAPSVADTTTTGAPPAY
jgi:hypothetical protein